MIHFKIERSAKPAPVGAGLFALECFKSILVVGLVLSSGLSSFGGAGTTTLAVLDPQPADGVSTVTAARVADEFHAEIQQQMLKNDVWGIELMTRTATTSAALSNLKSRAPRWKGEFSAGWKQFLNTNELVTYGALGRVRKMPGKRNLLEAQYEIWDFILNHRIAFVRASGYDIHKVGSELARQTIQCLQIYFAEIVESGEGRVTINIGIESLSTGTMLVAYGHDSSHPHYPGYPAHGHREEDEHLIGSNVYARYATQESQTSRSANAIKRTAPRRNSHRHLKLFRHQALPVNDLGTSAPAMSDSATSGSKGYEPWWLLSLDYDGQPTGILRVESFVKPNRYFNQYFAIARIVRGIAIPGGFIKVMTREEKQPRLPRESRSQ